MEENGEICGSLTLLPVGRLKSDQLQRRLLVPSFVYFLVSSPKKRFKRVKRFHFVLYLSKPQPNLNTRLGLTIKWLCTTPPPTHHRNSISAISQLWLIRFWWNFKGRFLWTSRVDSNCHCDICPGNICPCDICPGNICPHNICPYQEYLSSNWSDFDETLK